MWVTDFRELAGCTMEFHGLKKYWQGLSQSPFESEASSWEQICSTNRAAIIFNISSVMIVQICKQARGLLFCAGFHCTRTAIWRRSLHHRTYIDGFARRLPPQARFKSAWQGKMCSAIPFSIRAVLAITVIACFLAKRQGTKRLLFT